MADKNEIKMPLCLKPKEMNFVTTPLNMPLFMVQRNRFKHHHPPDEMWDYIAKRRDLLVRSCEEEHLLETANMRRNRHIAGYDKTERPRCPPKRAFKINRDLTRSVVWQQAANRYEVPMKPYEHLKGAGGAHWAKVHKTKAIPHPGQVRPQFQFYKKPGVIEDLQSAVNRHKGVFLTNARQRDATNRSMVLDPTTCRREKNQAGPAHYFPKAHTIEYKAPKPKIIPRPNSHLFYRKCSVPMKLMSIHRRHISFQPGPGRYETRFKGGCYCPPHKIYAPDLWIEIARQKRLKFRRKPFRKMKIDKYCEPNWSYVAGHGFRHLFVAPNIEEIRRQVQKDAKSSPKNLQLYAEGKYISLINNTQSKQMSIRSEPMVSLPPTLRFDCTAKRIRRKQLKNNKKIAFLSGQERFPDVDPPPPMSAAKLRKAIERLPTERQLHDHPVTKVPISEIKPKLTETPAHMRCFRTLDLRKRLFKFSPLPPPKILVTERDTRAASIHGRYEPPPLYCKKVNPEDFFKSEESQEQLEIEGEPADQSTDAVKVLEPATQPLKPSESATQPLKPSESATQPLKASESATQSLKASQSAV